MAEDAPDSITHVWIQNILDAASMHNNEQLEVYLDQYAFDSCASVDVLDPITKRCPLHFAVASCAKPGSHDADGESDLQIKASDTVRLLLENGAIWNQLDSSNETPGCLAYRLGLRDLYTMLVDAGVRCEMLLHRLEDYEPLGDDEDDDDSQDDEPGHQKENMQAASVQVDLQSPGESNTFDAPDILSDVTSKSYLSSALSFGVDKITDSEQNGVMMAWERDIMQSSAEAILDRPQLKILNVGAGMLIFDSIVQASTNKPLVHHIVEAHPDVLADMKAKGWMAKIDVVVHAGKWQDILPGLVEDGNTFDAIYFDTFAESYSDFREFFSEQVINLLSPDGKWSYFNGMGADRQISYDVYQKVVEIDLLESGFDVEWHEIEIPTLEAEWEGVKRRYWNVDHYRLPICRFAD